MESISLNYILLSSFAILLAALAISLFRLYKGPTISDRIAAMDLIASITMGFILVYSVTIKEPMYFDIVIIISLISFISTVAISTYLNQKK